MSEIKKRYNESYAMLLYAEIRNNIKTIIALTHYGIKAEYDNNDTLGGYLGAMESDLLYNINVLFDDNDEESKFYRSTLEQWDLLDNLKVIINQYKELKK